MLSLRNVMVVAALVAAPVAQAHIALWHPSMFGWHEGELNQYDPVLPQQHFTLSEWFFHGWKDQPPAPGVFMELPAGGTFHGEVACNKALTSYNPRYREEHPSPYACDGSGSTGGIGALHTKDAWESPNPTDVKGCGIAIAYTSDEHSVKPEDFAMISVNTQCPWFRDVDFQIPSDLPACPPGGCLCHWGWIHSKDGGSDQMYHLVYRCNVTGATNTTPLPKAQVARRCHYPDNTANCTVGPKQFHMWDQAEGNNNNQGIYDPPFYNEEWFIPGAQTDLYAGVSKNIVPVAATTSSAAPTTSTAPTTSSIAPTTTPVAAVTTSSPPAALVATTSSTPPTSAAPTTSSTPPTSAAPTTSSTPPAVAITSTPPTSAAPTTSLAATTPPAAIVVVVTASATTTVHTTSTLSPTTTASASKALKTCRTRRSFEERKIRKVNNTVARRKLFELTDQEKEALRMRQVEAAAVGRGRKRHLEGGKGLVGKKRWTL